MKKMLLLIFLIIPFIVYSRSIIFIDTERFENKGGWLVDAQFIDQLGSSYLLAHGLGIPVEDASTKVFIPVKDEYRVWVRTKDWAPFPAGPGKFKVIVDHNELDRIFGSNGSDKWKWIDGGKILLEQKTVDLTLKDLTGFEGRCDAIILSNDMEFIPPDDSEGIDELRRTGYDMPEVPRLAGIYDIVVVGGGMAGTCSAISASRMGLKVALIQNRPVLGGNNSSEIRVHLKGSTFKNHYPKLGRIVRELDNGDPGNASTNAGAYGDSRKWHVVKDEVNIDLYLNNHAFKVEVKDNKIIAVYAKHTRTNEILRFEGLLFADCTGDGTIGYLAGADFRMGRESRDETGESMAPDAPDDFTMGTSNLWNATETGKSSPFPECPWAIKFTDEYHWDMIRADWRWETGFGNFNTIEDAEKIRDHNFRAIYGNWSYLKNHKPEKYGNWTLNWVAYVGGKRESRRLMGDLILTQQDLQEHIIYSDACVTTTWDIDLHFPDSLNSKYYPGREFISWYKHPEIKPYPVPLRCLYSRNISNLMMAGRNISVTHVALGTVRVMRTGGMMGEVLGYAAYLCKKYDTTPRGVYQKHLVEFKKMLEKEMLTESNK